MKKVDTVMHLKEGDLDSFIVKDASWPQFMTYNHVFRCTTTLRVCTLSIGQIMLPVISIPVPLLKSYNQVLRPHGEKICNSVCMLSALTFVNGMDIKCNKIYMSLQCMDLHSYGEVADGINV